MRKPSTPAADFPTAESAEQLPSDFAIAPRTTGTVDDDDAPADERPDENEARVREKSESTLDGGVAAE
ncbi:MAG TPA: hypothetical protein VGE92_09020 [Steroidobacteraceae bacterium]|jgi:hypothetical protein